MAEYIEREALRKSLLIGAAYLDEDTMMTVVNVLDCFPAADVAPVVHGEWIFKWDSEKDPRRLFVRIVCSECNLHTGQKSTYCPNCGAKMDGERKDGEG